MTKADRVRELFRKEPDAHPKDVAQDIGIAISSVYAIRRQMGKIRRKPAMRKAKTQQTSIASDSLQRLAVENQMLRRWICELLAGGL